MGFDTRLTPSKDPCQSKNVVRPLLSQHGLNVVLKVNVGPFYNPTHFSTTGQENECRRESYVQSLCPAYWLLCSDIERDKTDVGLGHTRCREELLHAGNLALAIMTPGTKQNLYFQVCRLPINYCCHLVRVEVALEHLMTL